MELKSEDLNFIAFYPNLMKKLINGEKLYLKSFKGYLGREETVGPYCEEKIFVSEYDSTNIDLLELISDLDNKIKKEKTKIRKLSKLGNHYSE